MSSHTPGPWLIEDVGKSHVRISAKEWTRLAKVVVNVEGRREPQGVANARLIAAAPRLLEELELLCSFLEGCGIELPVEIEARIVFGRKAIAKARGDA